MEFLQKVHVWVLLSKNETRVAFNKLVGKLVDVKFQETGLFEAKTHLSEMVAKVEKRGTVYRITRRGKPIAELRPIGSGRNKVRLPFGYGEGSVPHLAADFDAPLDDFREYSA